MSYISIDELLDEIREEYSGTEEAPTAQIESEQNYQKIVEYLKHSNKTSICNFLTDGEAIHSPNELAMVLCNHIHKKVTSTVYLDETYKVEMISFFIENGETVYRSISQSSKDITYIFLYKNMFFVCHTFFGKNTTKGTSIYHPIDIPPALEDIEQFRVAATEEKPKIGIIKQTKYGLTVSNIKLESDQKFSLDHYNDDFSTFLDNITDKLNEKKPGLFLFHGEPGTGKSSAIRHLLTKVKRNFIFIPPQMINQLSTPEFADIITDTNKGSVLILEDAEKALMKRESEDGFSNSTLVSSVLNLTDGLYADLGNTAIIATYNCSRNLIDSALLRKGRMKAEYKFDKLSREKSQALVDKLGHTITVEEDMTLADIFNYEDQYTNAEDEHKTKFIGFNSGS